MGRVGTAAFHGGTEVGEGRGAGIRIAQLPEIHWRGPCGNHVPEEVPETLVDGVLKMRFHRAGPVPGLKKKKKKNDLGQKSSFANSGKGGGKGRRRGVEV